MSASADVEESLRLRIRWITIRLLKERGGLGPGRLEVVPPELNRVQLYRLVEIAADRSTDADARRFAVALLQRALLPPAPLVAS